MKMTTAVYPGTFDPITNGHNDIVARAAKIFDRVLVAVAENKGKKPLFNLAQRVDLCKTVLSPFANVEILPFHQLLVDFVAQHQAQVILRGLRAVSDFEYEFQLASMNRHLAPTVETLFLTPNDQFTFISSNLIKEMAHLGGNVDLFVHPAVQKALLNRIQNSKANP